MRSRCPILASSHRSTAPGAPTAFALTRRSRPSAIPELEVDVDFDADLELLGAFARSSYARTPRCSRVKVVLLSGGGGGARFARGLAAVLQPGELTVIGNVGDDIDILGLHVSPDLDSLLYALAGLIDTERGWGRAGESWNALESAASWGGEDWFRLGDRDLGLHLVRTEALRTATLSEATAALALRAGISVRVARPATDGRLRTAPHHASREVHVPGVVRRSSSRRRRR